MDKLENKTEIKGNIQALTSENEVGHGVWYSMSGVYAGVGTILSTAIVFSAEAPQDYVGLIFPGMFALGSLGLAGKGISDHIKSKREISKDEEEKKLRKKYFNDTYNFAPLGATTCVGLLESIPLFHMHANSDLPLPAKIGIDALALAGPLITGAVFAHRKRKYHKECKTKDISEIKEYFNNRKCGDNNLVF